MTRETQLSDAFVELVEAMVSGGDVLEFLHLLCCHATRLLDVTAAGVMLADENNRLVAVAASDERTHSLELLSMQHAEGPCPEAYRTGKRLQTATDDVLDRWPSFARSVREQGHDWICGVPLRHGNETLGALNLFRAGADPLPETQLRVAQALADVVTVSLLQRRETAQARRLVASLKVALSSRVLIEQAKGILAERHGLPPDQAFELLRRQARDRNLKLHDVAREVVYPDGGPAEADLESDTG